GEINKAPKPSRRRRLEVEVAPKGIVCSWETVPLRIERDPNSEALVSWQELGNESLYVLKHLPNAAVPPQLVNMRDVLRGGLGVYVRGGSAIFHRVAIRALQ